MNWLAILNEVFDILWLLAVLILLWVIYRSSERRLQHVKTMELTLVEVAKQDAESSRMAVDAVRTLAAVVQNQQAKNT